MNSDDVGRLLLEQLEFDVEAISTSHKKEADFIIKYNGVRALVEVKLKEDDPDLVAKKQEALDAGGVFVAEAALGRDETLSGIIRYAAQQLKSSSDNEHDFRFLLFIATGINARTKADQFVDTIYGSTKIMEVGKGNGLKTCYFFRNSDFYRRQIIDAAIVTYILGDTAIIRFCLNSCSPRYDLLRNSILLNAFGSSIIDPVEEEKIGKAYILDGDVNRKKTEFEEIFSPYDPALIYLAKKYKTGMLIKLDFDSPEISHRI